VAAKVSDAARRGRRRGELTVAQIARMAGVSAPTVSRVLNGRSGVGLDTRRKVEALLHEHGYRRPDTIAPAASIEVVFYALESHLAVEIMRGVERVTRKHGLAAAFTEVLGRDAESLSWADQLLARRPTGVIAVASGFTAKHHAQLAASAIPLVALDPTGEPLHSTASVGAANWNGGIAAARHVLELGHRRVAIVSGPAEYLCARARLDAARAALEAAGAPVGAASVRSGRFVFEDGLRLGAELLGVRPRPTAIICGNDLQALGVYEAARRAGLAIPGDLSVVGFDDIEYTRWCGPPMTSVRQPFADMGAAAAELVLDLAAGREPPHLRVELPTTLVVRDSTAPPPAS
jgi:LacI family transcriptional regulator, xylobiose transport system transcriptional regulator